MKNLLYIFKTKYQWLVYPFMAGVALTLMVMFSGCVHAGVGNLLNVEKQENSIMKANEASLIKASDISLLKANQDINAMKIQGMLGDIAGVKSNIGKLMEANIKMQAQIEANMQATVGFNNAVQNLKNTAGRDVNQSINDTKLMNFIIAELSGLCTLLIVGYYLLIKSLIMIMREKKFYKEQTLLKLSSEEELIRMRSLHNQFTKKGELKNEKADC